MPQFRYVARNPEGKLVDGTLTCNDRAAAILQVERERFVPIRIEAIADSPKSGAPSNRETLDRGTAKSKTEASPARTNGAQKSQKPDGAKAAASTPNSHKSLSKTDGAKPEPPATIEKLEVMTHSQRYLFTEQLSNLLCAGITLDEALGILVKRMRHPRLQALSKGLHRSLVDGRSLSQALKDYPKIFSPLYVNMVAAGEASGALGDILKRLVQHLSDVKGLSERVQQALLYPAFLVLAGIGLVIVFMTKMVPKLLSFFKDTGQALPPATRLLLDVNHLIMNYWWVAVAGCFGLFTLFKIYTRTPDGRLVWDAFLWRLPVYSSVIRRRFYAQFARTLGTLVENGVTMLKGLELMEESSGNEYVRTRMHDVRRAVVDGATLSTALGEQKIFPDLFTDMLSVGEQTGRFGQSLGNIADIYERELDKQVQIISTLIPPVVMVGIAGIVGVIVYAIMTAVFSLTQGLHTQVH